MATYEGSYQVQYTANCKTVLQLYFIPNDPDPKEQCYNDDACAAVPKVSPNNSNNTITTTATTIGVLTTTVTASTLPLSLASATSMSGSAPMPTLSPPNLIFTSPAPDTGLQKVNQCANYPYNPVDPLETGLSLMGSGFVFAYNCTDPLNQNMQMFRVKSCMPNWDTRTNSTGGSIARVATEARYMLATLTESSNASNGTIVNLFYYSDNKCSKFVGGASKIADYDGCSGDDLYYSVVRDPTTVPDGKTLSCKAVVNGTTRVSVPNATPVLKSTRVTGIAGASGSGSVSFSATAAATTTATSDPGASSAALNAAIVIGVVVGVFVIGLGLVAYFLHVKRNQIKDSESIHPRSIRSQVSIEEFTVLKMNANIAKPDPFLNTLAAVPAVALNIKKSKESFERLPANANGAGTSGDLDLPDHPNEWNMEDVVVWVAANGGDQNTFDAIRAGGIDGKELLSGDLAALCEALKPQVLGDSVILRDAIDQLQQKYAAPTY
ncbi:hypothetical protein BDR26DRAFT_194274 [Obelidium mucronatum]|nr:hypothetical protein BDR26DRAFT_194274 [Obelidium mucronatum]